MFAQGKLYEGKNQNLSSTASYVSKMIPVKYERKIFRVIILIENDFIGGS
jgi:hypothetical protein